MKGVQILKQPADVLAFVPDVRKLADQIRDTFGFLPSAAYKELASEGRLWIATDKKATKVLGYILFGGRFPILRIFQVYCSEGSRRSGIGRLLVLSLIRHAEKYNYLFVSARVAADLEINAFWEKLNFQILDQVIGGKKTKRRINIRAYELDTTSLLSSLKNTKKRKLTYKPGPILTAPTYILDLNVFFDVLKNRLRKKQAARVFSGALDNQIRICVTTEFAKELQRHSQNQSDDPLLTLALQLPTLPAVPKTESENLANELRSIIFPNRSTDRIKSNNDDSDLAHLAACIHHKVYGFVTSEMAILKTKSELKEAYGLEIVSPSDIYGPSSNIKPKVDLATLFGEEEVTIKELKEDERTDHENFLLGFKLTNEEISYYSREQHSRNVVDLASRLTVK